MHGTELALERRDPCHARLKVRLADRALPELSLEGSLLLEDHVPQALRLSRHDVEQPLHRLELAGAQTESALSHRIEHVTWPRVSVQLGGPGQTHPAPFAELRDLLLGEASNLGGGLVAIGRSQRILRGRRCRDRQDEHAGHEAAHGRYPPLISSWADPAGSAMSELGYGEQVDAEWPERPPARSTGGLPASRSSDFRELASLDQINEHVPLVVGENREIPGLTDPDLITRELHFRAGAATE